MVVVDTGKVSRYGFDVYLGREAPGGNGKLIDFATDERSIWVWAFGWELIVSRRGGRPTTK